VPSGRKKRSGAREANGRLKRIKAAQRDATAIEKRDVLAQPHRHGDLDQRLESPLGRFTLRQHLRPEIFDAGVEYGHLARVWLAAKVASRIGIVEAYAGSRPVTARARWLTKELFRLETPLKKLDPVGFSGLRALAVYERDVIPRPA
jgi:hypothetical protein